MIKQQSMESAVMMLYLAAVCTLYIAVRISYNLLFHPLRSFPGPWLWRISRLPYVWKTTQGHLPMDILAAHEKYGPIVRVTPNELAISHDSAWRDVMAGSKELRKWTEYYKVQDPQPMYIMNAPDDEHATVRRSLAFGFSDKAMREMEPIIQGYIKLFVQRLRETCNKVQGGTNGEPSADDHDALDLHKWFNFLTFDLIGDLAVGESYNCLEKGEWHPWVAPIFEVTHMSAVMSSLSHYPWLKKTLLRLFRDFIDRQMRDHQAHTLIKLEARMKIHRSDLLQGLLKAEEYNDKSIEKINLDASVLVVAGAETSATTLSAVVYLLLNNPKHMSKLLSEIRGTFTTEDEITIATVSRLEYMLACLEETMRLFPPVPIGLPRIVPNEGRSISGHYIPGNTHVSIWHWALYRNREFFTKPLDFCPERFMGDAEYATDRLDAFQPFHLGKRSCVGRPLAYVEMRLVLARLLFNFDLELAEESRDWMAKSKAYNIWWKPPLKIRISERQCVQ